MSLFHFEAMTNRVFFLLRAMVSAVSREGACVAECLNSNWPRGTYFVPNLACRVFACVCLGGGRVEGE